MRPKLPAEIERAIVLREAGWTLSGIVEQTSISASTLQRAFKRHSVERGGLTSNAVERAREQLLQDAGFLGEIKHTIASIILDDISLARRIRESLLITLEEIDGDKLTPAVVKARSLAALSTALSITQAVSRKALNADDSKQTLDELPVLEVRRMTDDDIREVQESLREGNEDDIDD